MEEGGFAGIPGVEVAQQQNIDPIEGYAQQGGTDKIHGERLLVVDAISFDIGELHFSRPTDQLFQGVRQTFIEVSEKMRHLVE